MTVGSMLTGAFALLKARPGSVAIWALINLALTIGTAYGTMLVMDAQIMSGSPLVWSFFGNLLLVYLVVMMISAVVYTAVLRVALRPEEEGLASLRLGMDEVRQFLLAFLYMLAFIVMLFVLSFLLAIFMGIASDAAGGPAGMSWFLYILIFVAVAWFCTRISLSFPLTMMRRRFVVGEAWSLTVGHFWTLLGAYLVIFAIMFAATLLVGVVTEPDYLATLFDPNSRAAQEAVYSEYVRLRYGEVDAMMILGWLLSAAISTVGMTLWAGAATTAARELSGDIDGLAETFS